MRNISKNEKLTPKCLGERDEKRRQGPMLLNQACLAHPLLRAPRTINEAEIGGSLHSQRESVAAAVRGLRCLLQTMQMQTRGVVRQKVFDACPLWLWLWLGAKHYCR